MLAKSGEVGDCDPGLGLAVDAGDPVPEVLPDPLGVVAPDEDAEPARHLG